MAAQYVTFFYNDFPITLAEGHIPMKCTGISVVSRGHLPVLLDASTSDSQLRKLFQNLNIGKFTNVTSVH